jgi:hypothetical protein
MPRLRLISHTVEVAGASQPTLSQTQDPVRAIGKTKREKLVLPSGGDTKLGVPLTLQFQKLTLILENTLKSPLNQ